jgi:eukaryotic-like serine/threonine-protein kinase
MQFWNELEGQVFDGLYPLRRLVRSEGRSAWFETWVETKAGDGRPATISLTESLTDADEVADRLESAQRLRHANLLSISKVGRARFENTLFVYALMEYTEQSLSDVLRDQPLSKEEAQQVGEALAGALTTIHRQGLFHGRVEPASVLAVGEMVKLRSDCLQSPGGTRAGDVAGIGATLFQAFTQRKPEAADDAQINRLPAPFAEIVRNSLSARWGLAQVAAALRPASAVVMPEPPQVPRAADPVSAAAAPGQSAPGKPAPPAQEPPRAAKPAAAPPAASTISSRPLSSREERPSREETDETPSNSGRPLTLYVAIGLVLLLLIGWLIFRPKGNSTANPVSSQQASSPQAAPAPPPGPNPEAAAPAAAPAPAQAPKARPAKPPAVRVAPAEGTPPAAEPASANGRPVWRVIAFTYNREDQAQRKVAEISQQHSDLRPSVFSVPKGGQTRFLVTIGGAMDRSRAQALRDKASAMGLPADTYIQNFSQ